LSGHKKQKILNLLPNLAQFLDGKLHQPIRQPCFRLSPKNNTQKYIDKMKIVSYTKIMGNEELSNYIVIDQGVRFGKPCIKGTRITVGDILQWLSEGIPVSEILDDYPLLKEVHIQAALAFAARREEIIKVIVAV
jgi:uncharacterized protein (DUF433 family)